MATKKFDVIIIGGGAAGLTAAIYTCRRKLNTAIITVDIGGQTNLTNHIENYPGTDAQAGMQLMNKFKENVDSFGANTIYGRVGKVKKLKHGFAVKLTNGEVYSAKGLILAFGKVPRKLGLPGEEKFFGRGISTCATCDAPLFEGKTIAVVGGGNSALEAAELLSKIAKKVYLIHRRKEFRGDEITQAKIKKSRKVEILYDTVLTEFLGDKLLSKIKVKNVKTDEDRQLDVQGVFLEIGYIVDSEIVKGLVRRNKAGEIIINKDCATSDPAIFAAGDITDTPYKQTVISAGEGAKAALSLYKYLSGSEKIGADWH